MTHASGITHASDIYGPLLAVVVPVLVIVVLALLAVVEWRAIFVRLRERAEVRRANRQLRREAELDRAVRPISREEKDAAESDLDAWEAEMYVNLDAALPESWTQPIGEPEPESWPVPLSPRLTDLAEHYAAPQPLPPRAEVAVYRPDPHWATIAPNYGRDTSEWRWERDSGVPVVDEQSHAAEVLQNLSRPKTQNTAALALSQAFGHVVDAMPVSPAPQGRTRRAKGHNPGTDAQRLDPAFVSWEQPTGAFALVGVR